ncbi:hypothetical protein [Spirosoma oryzicola]|uniref:hypothetical protein n=1 Tax=Spirosoma oryzicola TaxID=2898794 RepID=UPI001E3E1F77|nr:hypothetical protein [Spirosoma oryzicola]UHG91755.1 hypothetical protein LQ777_02385 [Spirosoma oryzicola]
MQSSTFPTKQAQQDLQLLQDFLFEKVYNDPKRLYDSEVEDLVEYCFRQYYVFLFNSYSLEAMYKHFQQEVYKMLELREVSSDEAEYCLRSGRFCQFAQKLMKGIKNETNQVPPSASTSGEDLTHVCA